jgi:hypothetical protein
MVMTNPLVVRDTTVMYCLICFGEDNSILSDVVLGRKMEHTLNDRPVEPVVTDRRSMILTQALIQMCQ